ncbi:transporter [Altererythrobacter salegens]|uniref:Transporter n=1 Tax=Croceibacterium salegens TaxID=1737568 RepID=A0A6I4SZG7_9SPHN|nr:transporter [Croceibacterium salegens]MXO60186.1 transporter [Croceibacterium salegens]
MHTYLKGLAGCVLAVAASPALASEGGTSFYLLGSGGPGAAVAPPVEGIFIDNTVYIYDGSAKVSKEFVVGGQIVAGLDATVVADFPTVLFVPSTDFAGGVLQLGATFPVGHPNIDASVVLTGPGGGVRQFDAFDNATVIGDPVATVQVSWPLADNLFIQPTVQVNIPVGNYREDQLANLAFNRWIYDGSVAMSLHDMESGWDVSGKVGVTFNGTNDYTQYKSGDEFHAEAAIEKAFSPSFSLGVQGYYFDQLSGDSGPGARLGPFKGKTVAGGLTAAFNFLSGKTPVTARFRAFKEFDVRNRLKGSAFFFSLTFPIKMNLPPEAG